MCGCSEKNRNMWLVKKWNDKNYAIKKFHITELKKPVESTNFTRHLLVYLRRRQTERISIGLGCESQFVSMSRSFLLP